MNSAAQGDKALANFDCLSALRHFTQALVELPRAPAYYIKRSTAYSRVKAADGGPKSSASLRDAEIALTLARERGKRELILSAQMRRGVALYQLERYGDAGFVFGMVKGKSCAGTENKDKSEEVKKAMAGGAAASGGKNGFEQELPIWMAKVTGRLNKLAEGDEKATVSVAEYPSGIRVPTEKDLKEQLEALKSGKKETEGGQSQSSQQSQVTGTDKTATQEKDGAASAPAPAAAAATPAPVPDKVRREWYQSHDSVVVTLYVKGILKDSVDVELKNDSVALQFPLPSGADYAFSLDPLFATIDPSTSKVSVMSTKIEISLRKQTPGQKWNTLEASSTDVKIADRQAATASKPATDAGPSYPTSSRHGAKDWDKVASTLTDKKPKSKDPGKGKGKDKKDKKEAGKDGDESDAESVDSDYGGGDPVDGFFKKLYASADPDTRRAMMKSYVESQGTSLSTNWGEVSQGKVEARPPSE